MLPSHLLGSDQISRRRFIVGSAAAAAGALAASAFGQEKAADRISPRIDKINIGVVGAGGRGTEDISGCEGQNFIALCDVDDERAAGSFKKFPNAKRYKDWRKMLEAEKNLEAVIVATPDHNHAIVSIHAMKLGKHVYCEKPLTRTIYEARQMAKVAAEMKVQTQMGTQGHAFEGSRQAVEVIRSGAIGDVTEVHVWSDRPGSWWQQGIDRPTDEQAIPATLDWDTWLGPAPQRPYNKAYVPFTWRGFWDFGTGAIGDMGIHNFDTAFWALELGPPTSVEVKDAQGVNNETGPKWCIIEINFPARGAKPPVKLTWYDGLKKPPTDLFQGEKRPTNGSLIVGSKGTLFTRTWHGGGEADDDFYVLLPRREFEGYKPPPQILPRAKSHHKEWLAAIRGVGAPLSNFGYAAVLTESLLLGNVALRCGKKLEWDAPNMRAINIPQADQFIRPQFRAGWSL
jgi:predicted dehydrogenase